jgi:hypothetical protein
MPPSVANTCEWAATHRVSPEEGESFAARRAPDEGPMHSLAMVAPDYAHVPSAWIRKMDVMGCTARNAQVLRLLSPCFAKDCAQDDSHAACLSQTDPLSNIEVHGTFPPSGGTMQGLPSRAVRCVPQSYTISTPS